MFEVTSPQTPSSSSVNHGWRGGLTSKYMLPSFAIGTTLEVMKTFLTLFALLSLLPITAHSALRGTPFLPEIDQRFSDLEGGSGLGTGSVSSTNILDGTILNADVNASAAIAYSKLAALTSTNILLGNSSNVATSTAVTGDVTISNTGVTAIGAGKVTEAMLLPMASSTSSLNVKRTAHLIWDPTTTAAHRTGTNTAFGAGFGASIPANSLITKVYFYTKTAVVSTGNNGTIAFNCLGAGDLLAAVDPDGTWGLANGMGSGTITGIPVAGVSYVGLVVAAGCTPTLTVATNNFTGGRVHIYIDYVTFD